MNINVYLLLAETEWNRQELYFFNRFPFLSSFFMKVPLHIEKKISSDFKGITDKNEQ